MNMSTPMLVTFLVYIAAMIFIGFWAWRSTKNFSDYILGGRSLGSVVTALSAGASDMSGWLLMGLPGAIYLAGLSKAWIAIGLIIGAWLNWLFVAGRLRVHTEHCNNALTLPDYFTHRFEDKQKILRIVSATVILFFFALYCASGAKAAALLFESTFGFEYATALWLGTLATIFYVFIGGFLAVSWTDTVQATLMIFALLITPIFIILALGDASTTLATIKVHSPTHLDMFEGMTFLGIVSLLGWGLGYLGQPHILVRFMAADSVKTIPAARRIGMAWMILCLGGAVAVGFLGYPYFVEHPELAAPVNEDHERVFIELAKILFNPWVAGIILAAVLAAVMSTLSCQLLVCSSAITEDFYKAFLRKKASQKELVWVGRIMVLLIALLALYMASDPKNKVLSLVSYAWAGFGAAFGPVVLLSVTWKRMTRNGALAGMVVGAITVVLWQEGLPRLNVLFPMPWLETLIAIYNIIPGFIFAVIAIVIASLLDKQPSQSMQQRFDAADNEFKAV
ncbi:sodium/proline symporter PutP [Pseudomonas sp. F1_0610]|uniref:sodium/proline symporter PutP n=1 Tax=Pseudomonas sp. F1_0610 TaxID=3114284 RepID=UPI0039C3B36D